MPELPIRTPSLLLRHFMIDEAAAIRELNGEPSTSHWLPSHVYADLAQAHEAVQYLIDCYSNPGHPTLGPYVLAVEDARSLQLIGHVGFSPLDGEVEVSYAIAESSRGRGFGTEALDHASAWIAEVFQLQSILAVTATGNDASRRTLEKAHFMHVRDETMRFQSTHQIVSRYRRQFEQVLRQPP